MITALDLLYKAIDYTSRWTSAQMKNSEPAKCRLQQLEKMLQAFDIDKNNALKIPLKTSGLVTAYSVGNRSINRHEFLKSLSNAEYFTSGEFLEERPQDDYKDLHDEIVSKVKKLQAVNDLDEYIDFRSLFSTLFSDLNLINVYMIHHDYYPITKVTYENEYIAHLRTNFREVMDSNLSETHTFLCRLIDPYNRSFTEEEIEYPQFDLEAIDKKW